MELINSRSSLFTVIVDFGKGSKMLKELKKLGASGGTFFLGKGTVSNSLLDILGLTEIRKEILMVAIEEEDEDKFFQGINEKFHLDKPNHGIAFTMPLKYCLGIRDFKCEADFQSQGGIEMEHEAIFTIVDKGLSDKVIDAAKEAGARGGTVIHGRGSGTQDKEILFNITIEPEKEIVLILSPLDKASDIIESIKEKLDIEEPGKGIIFALDVNRTLGLYNGK